VRGLRGISAGSERAHEETVPALAKRVDRQELAADAFGIIRPVPLDLRVADGFEGLDLDVAKDPPLSFDPRAVLAGKQPSRRDLVRDHRLGPRFRVVALAPEALDVVDRRPRAFAVDEDVGGQAQRVRAGGGSEHDLGGDRRHRRANAARERVEARVGGLGRVVAPEHFVELCAPDGSPPIEHEVDPQPAAEPSWKHGLVEDAPVCLEEQASAYRDTHITSKSQGGCPRIATRVWEDTMKYTVTITGRLRDDPAAAKRYHDEVTKATKDAAKQAGDLTHAVYLDPQDPKAFFGVDTWSSLEGIQGFAGSPQIREFFGKLFDGQPDVHVWVGSDWNQW